MLLTAKTVKLVDRDAGTEIDISGQVIQGSVRVVLPLPEPGKLAYPTCSVSIVLTPEILSLLLFGGNVGLRVINEDGVCVFEGDVRGNLSYRSEGVRTEPVKLEAVSVVERLLNADETYTLTNFAVCDPAHPGQSVVHYIANRYGLPVSGDPSVPAIDRVVPVVRVTEDHPAAEALAEVLAEYGYVARVTGGGEIKIVPYYTDDTSTLPEDTTVADLRVSVSDVRHDGVRVEWSELRTETDVVVAMDTTGATDIYECYIPLAPGETYPPFGEGYIDYDIEDAAHVYNVRLDIEHTGNLAVSFEPLETKARILIENLGTSTEVITRLRVIADVQRAGARHVHMWGEKTPSRPRTVTARYITNDTDGVEYAQKLYARDRYGRIQVSWVSEQEHLPGDMLRVNDPNAGAEYVIQVSQAVITDLSGALGRWSYRGYLLREASVGSVQGQEAIAGTVSVPVPVQQVQNVAINQVYEDMVTGFDVAGGTTAPVAPQGVEARAFFRTVVLRWDRQSNLTNLAYYEVQVAESTSGPWYALGSGGAWAGEQGGVTRVTIEVCVHEGVPLAGTEDNPQPRTLYYRVRTVTTAGAMSEWSSVVSATVTPASGGDIEAESIRAGKLETGVINTLFAQVNEAIRVNHEGLGSRGMDTEVLITDEEVRFYGDNRLLGYVGVNGTSGVPANAWVARSASDVSNEIYIANEYDIPELPYDVEHTPAGGLDTEYVFCWKDGDYICFLMTYRVFSGGFIDFSTGTATVGYKYSTVTHSTSPVVVDLKNPVRVIDTDVWSALTDPQYYPLVWVVQEEGYLSYNENQKYYRVTLRLVEVGTYDIVETTGSIWLGGLGVVNNMAKTYIDVLRIRRGKDVEVGDVISFDRKLGYVRWVESKPLVIDQNGKKHTGVNIATESISRSKYPFFSEFDYCYVIPRSHLETVFSRGGYVAVVKTDQYGRYYGGLGLVLVPNRVYTGGVGVYVSDWDGETGFVTVDTGDLSGNMYKAVHITGLHDGRRLGVFSVGPTIVSSNPVFVTTYKEVDIATGSIVASVEKQVDVPNVPDLQEPYCWGRFLCDYQSLGGVLLWYWVNSATNPSAHRYSIMKFPAGSAFNVYQGEVGCGIRKIDPATGEVSFGKNIHILVPHWAIQSDAGGVSILLTSAPSPVVNLNDYVDSNYQMIEAVDLPIGGRGVLDVSGVTEFHIPVAFSGLAYNVMYIPKEDLYITIMYAFLESIVTDYYYVVDWEVTPSASDRGYWISTDGFFLEWAVGVHKLSVFRQSRDNRVLITDQVMLGDTRHLLKGGQVKLSSAPSILGRIFRSTGTNTHNCVVIVERIY